MKKAQKTRLLRVGSLAMAAADLERHGARAADGLRIRHKQQFLCRCFRIGIGG